MEACDVQHAVCAVTPPAAVAARLVDLQRVRMEIWREQTFWRNQRRIAVLEGTEPTDIVAAIAVLFLASVEHVILVQLLA